MTFIANQIGLSDSSGYIYMYNGATGVSFAFTTAYQQLASLGVNFVLSANAKDFVMTTDGQLKYIGKNTKTFLFDAAIQPTLNNFSLQLYKNGSPVTGSQSYAPGSKAVHIQKFPIEMATNDYVSVYARRIGAATDTIYQVILSASIANGS